MHKCCGLFWAKRNKKQAQSRLQNETRREAVKTRNEAEAVENDNDDVAAAAVDDHHDVAEEASAALAKKERKKHKHKQAQLENLM